MYIYIDLLPLGRVYIQNYKTSLSCMTLLQENISCFTAVSLCTWQNIKNGDMNIKCLQKDCVRNCMSLIQILNLEFLYVQRNTTWYLR